MSCPACAVAVYSLRWSNSWTLTSLYVDDRTIDSSVGVVVSDSTDLNAG